MILFLAINLGDLRYVDRQRDELRIWSAVRRADMSQTYIYYTPETLDYYKGVCQSV